MRKRQKIVDELKKNFTFNPKINSVYQFDQDFAERQIYYNEISEKNMKE
jgi:hypothetical protein